MLRCILILITVFVLGCQKDIQQKNVKQKNIGFLYLGVDAHPIEWMEVVVNGKSLGTFYSPKTGSDPRIQRITFTASKNAKFVFRLGAKDKMLYQPKFTITTNPGSLLRCQFLPSKNKPILEGPAPREFPALITGNSKLWCWFGTANITRDYFMVSIKDKKNVEKVSQKITKSGHKILRKWLDEPKQGKALFRINVPQKTNIVEAILKVEKWQEIEKVSTEAKRIH